MENKNKKLNVGDVYLTISVLGQIKLVAFKNKDKKGDQPDYLGNGVAIWVNHKKADAEVIEV